MAAATVLAALPPASGVAQSSEETNPFTLLFLGTGVELLAEQLRDAGVEYVFIGNGTGVSPLCDALVDRPDLKLVLAVHEPLCVAIADGYSRASGKTAFTMFSRGGEPAASSSLYKALKDRSRLVVASDRSEAIGAGRA